MTALRVSEEKSIMINNGENHTLPPITSEGSDYKKIHKNTFFYEKITHLSESTTPFTERTRKTPPRNKRGRGGHASERE
jgi:hypothetical protein